MAQMIPDLPEDQLAKIKSSAEAKLYRIFRDNLPQDYVVLFQVGWILQRESDKARDGETDFIICHPNTGYFCIEVKGGGISFNGSTGEWSSIDKHKTKHSIKDPVNQALRAKYSILNKLKEHPQWKSRISSRILIGHAVFFPDISYAHQIDRPDLPAILIGTLSNTKDITSWVKKVFEVWSNDDEQYDPLDFHGIEIIKNIFAHSFEVNPLVSQQLKELEEYRIRLTHNQMRTLDTLRSHRRASISGGAGTGKTLLAVEKAKRLAGEGFITLLTCYNRQLADHLSLVCKGIDNLEVMSFHQLCYLRIDTASQLSDRDVLEEAKLTYKHFDLFDVHYPVALTYSLDIVSSQYDAIVCDEGQDFREEYWLPIEMLLSNYDTSPLYIFFDDNQNIYSRASTFLIKNEPFLLVTNCRNTDPIHHAAYEYYQGEPVSPSGVLGEKIQLIEAATPKLQAKRLHSKIVDLIAKEHVSPAEIVVLVVNSIQKEMYFDLLFELPLPHSASWIDEGGEDPNCVRIDTVKRFKGLESAIVFLWGLDVPDLGEYEELLYVGLSRAKSLVYIVGMANTCKQI